MRVPTHRPGMSLWSRKDFPVHLDDAGQRLAGSLLARIQPLGALRDPCESRVLESALCLRLLEAAGLEPLARSALVNYLKRRGDTVDPLDRVLVGAALDGRAESPSAFMNSFLAKAPRFTSLRKQVMIDAILALFGFDPPVPDPAAFELTGLHSWARVQVVSLKVIMDRALDRARDIRPTELELLLSTQQTADVWEGNVLIHLSVLNALAGLPGMDETVEQGIRKVLKHQRADGGIPFVTDTDTWCTSTAGLALSAIGAPHQELHRLAGHLVRQQRGNGGWAFTDLTQQTDVDDISVAVEFLHTLDRVRYRTSIEAALDCLRRVRDGSGGFPTYIEGEPPEACMTAAAVNALGVQRDRHSTAIQDGLAFLEAAQRRDGSFEPDWSASSFHTVFRAVLATGQADPYTAPASGRIRERALGLVHGAQNPDGGWGWRPGDASDALSSSYALIALSAQDDVGPAIRAAEFILSCQRQDGTVSAPSDSIGPRPFIFRVAALADIFALLALGHLSSRLEPAAPARDSGASGLLRHALTDSSVA